MIFPGQQVQEWSHPPLYRQIWTRPIRQRQQALFDAIVTKNGQWFDLEMDKLDRWAEDRRTALKADLDDLDQQIKETRKAVRLAPTLSDKLERQRALRKLETRRDEAWRSYDEASRTLDRQKDTLLDEISHRLA